MARNAQQLRNVDLTIQPDWTELWHIEEAERELRGFKFIGPGWYHTKNDSMLVMPVGHVTDICPEAVWLTKGWRDDQLFRFMVYNDRNPIDAFNFVVNAPVRLQSYVRLSHDELVSWDGVSDACDVHRAVKLKEKKVASKTKRR